MIGRRASGDYDDEVRIGGNLNIIRNSDGGRRESCCYYEKVWVGHLEHNQEL